MEKQEFLQAFESVLSEFGFIKRKNRYYKDYQEILMVFFPQKSIYGDTYYIEYGYCLKAYNQHLPYPPIYEADYRERLGMDLFPEAGKLLYQVDYDKTAADAFVAEFKKRAAEVIIPDDIGGMQFFTAFLKATHPNRIPTRIKKLLGLPLGQGEE